MEEKSRTQVQRVIKDLKVTQREKKRQAVTMQMYSELELTLQRSKSEPSEEKQSIRRLSNH